MFLAVAPLMSGCDGDEPTFVPRRRDLTYVFGNVGVEGGVISGGHRLEGAAGYAGKVGHLRLNPDGRTCHCVSRDSRPGLGSDSPLLGAAEIALAPLFVDPVAALASSLLDVRSQLVG